MQFKNKLCNLNKLYIFFFSIVLFINIISTSISSASTFKIKDLEIVAGKNDSELIVHVQRRNKTASLLLK